MLDFIFIVAQFIKAGETSLHENIFVRTFAKGKIF